MHTELEQEQVVARLLRALPDDTARPYDFSEFQRRARAAAPAAAPLAGARALAAAVVIAVVVLAGAIRFGAGPRALRPPAAPAAADIGVSTVSTASSDVPGAERDAVAAQYWLERLPREPALVRVGTRAAVEALEDHIAQVDDLLTSERAGSAPPARLHVLQQERAQLVSSLIQVRYAETLANASR